MDDPYDELGVSPTATADQIRRAYRRRIRAVHPDTRHGDEEAAKAANAAYAVLADPRRRQAYDESRNSRRDATSAPVRAQSSSCPYCGIDLSRLVSVDDHLSGHAAAVPSDCRVCGRQPVANVIYQFVVGFVLYQLRFTFEGTVCRDCSRGVFRRQQARCLAWGWWSPVGILLTMYCLAMNYYQLRLTRSLPSSMPKDSDFARVLRGRPVLLQPSCLAVWSVIALAVALLILI